MAKAEDGTVDDSGRQVGASPQPKLMVANPSALLETDLFVPRYRPMRSGRWELRVGGAGIAPGYWGASRLALEMPMLLREGVCWMSITPLEIESQEIGIRLAKGHVAIFGLGMGWAAAATAMRDRVERVTVVEQDPDVVALHNELDLFAQLPPDKRAKIRIVEGDALAWRPDAPVDLLMPDIWLPLVSDGRIDEVRRMHDNVRAAAVYFWGQELEIARHARVARRELDAAGIAATAEAFALPLLGPDWPDYPALVAAAAERWMKDRWI